MRRQPGFTLVELIMTMVILGMLSAVALPKLTGNSAFAGAAFRGDIVGALRHAQKTAVGHRRLVCATLGASSVALAIAPSNPAAACSAALPGATGEPYASKDAAVSAGGALLGQLFFQPGGGISTDAGGNNPAAGVVSVTGQADIALEGATGYVE